MSLSNAFLDELRARTTLSTLIGRSVKVTKAGREFKACCPFHNEKTASFTINDEKGFYHCFGCGAHGDAIRWMTDQRGMDFIDAVKTLAGEAGLEVPARSDDEAQRAAARDSDAAVLDAAAAWFARKLAETPAAQQMLAARGVEPPSIARFGLGLAPSKGGVSLCGAAVTDLRSAGLLVERELGSGEWTDRFRARLMIPIHDARGRVVGFGGRAMLDKQSAKYINSEGGEGAAFDKGRTLYNLHRAAPAAREKRRLIIVEGYFDVIALDAHGLSETVAPMGTAITEAQLVRAWRVHHCPILLMDGDAAGQAAAMKAALRALPMAAPGQSLAFAELPHGMDPDDVVRKHGKAAIDIALDHAVPLVEMVWRAALAEAERAGPIVTPEARSGLSQRLGALVAGIADDETRAEYNADLRNRLAAAFPPPPPGVADFEMLPDGRVERLEAQPANVAAQLRRVAKAWLEREGERCEGTAKALGRLHWEAGRRVAGGLVDEDAARATVADAIERTGFADDAAPFEDSWAAGVKRDFDISGMLLDRRCAGFQRTDMGNAERFRARYGRDYLYTTAKGWLGWDGHRYQVLNQEKDVTPAEVLGAVFETVRAIQREAFHLAATGVDEPDEPLNEESPVRVKAHWRAHFETKRQPDALDTVTDYKSGKAVLLSDLVGRWGRASEASGRIGCIANLARRWLSVDIGDFDRDPMLLNCQNGTLVFHRAEGEGDDRRGAWVELRDHDRADMLTKVTACDYHPQASAPEFLRTVDWAQPKAARARYLQQWLGYSLTGDMGEQIFHIWWGPTAANGKSTIGNACRNAIGDYGATINVQTFLDEGTKKRGDQATPDLVQLPGVRFLTSGEVPVGAKINEALINTVTGGDEIKVRDNFRSFFSLLPIFKWTLWCNERPEIPRGTEGIWRRVKVLLWESHLEEHQKDRDLPRRLAGEHAGILAWMVDGLIDWMDNGFTEPDDVTEASADYKDDSDTLARFLRACCVIETGAKAQSSHLFELFAAWSKATGGPEWKQIGFTKAMKGKGFRTKPSNGMQWLDIKMVREPGDYVDKDGRVIDLGEDGAGGGGGHGRWDQDPGPPDDSGIPGYD